MNARFKEWVAKHYDGVLSEVEHAELHQALGSCQECRNYFLEYGNLISGLEEQAMADSSVRAWQGDDAAHSHSYLHSLSLGKAAHTKRASRMQLGIWKVAAMLGFLLAAYAYFSPRGSISENEVAQDEVPKKFEADEDFFPVALVAQEVDVVWEEGVRKLSQGDVIGAEEVKFVSGHLRLDFFSGASVWLKGNTRFELVDEMHAICHEGVLRADVPPAATGFRIKAGARDVVDIGTAFGLQVSPSKVGADAEVAVHVIDGQVDIYDDTEKERELYGGEALQWVGQGEFHRTSSQSGLFPDGEALDSVFLEERAQRRKRWQDGVKAWGEDNRLIAFYPFEERALRRQVFDQAQSISAKRHGTMVGCGEVPGRFPGKSAVEFPSVSDRVRVHIPGEYASLTMSCWVSLQGLPYPYNALLLTDDYDFQEVHWQIDASGQLMFSICSEGKQQRRQNQIYYSCPFFDEELKGRWVHLAVTYDGRDGRVKQYVNGECVGDEIHETQYKVIPLRIGSASLGNWGVNSQSMERKKGFYTRNLNGKMDEFAMFSEVLSQDEILKMFQEGNPYE